MNTLMLRAQCILIGVLMFAIARAENVESSPPSKGDVQSAWLRRHAAIHSIDATYSITESRVGRTIPPSDPNDPMQEIVPANDTTLKLVFTFVYKDGRIASTLDGDAIFQGGKTGRRINTAAFDGKEYRTLLQERSLTMGSFDRRGHAGAQLTSLVHSLPIWLWFHPDQIMEKVVWDIAAMEIDKEPHSVGNTKCWRLRIPRRSPAWVSHLYVDDSPDSLPRQWDMIYRGVLTSSFRIDYQEDSDGRPFISQWRAVHNSEKGVLESTCLAKFQRFQINRTIDDKTIELEFPVGTQIVEVSDEPRRYYIQEKSGMRRINESDYGRHPANAKSN